MFNLYTYALININILYCVVLINKIINYGAMAMMKIN